MIRTIISHDIDAGTARIRFEHNGVTVEDDYVLINVVPSTKYVFEQMGLVFDESYQQLAIERLTTSIEGQIESGGIKNAPPVEAPLYEAPPEPTETEVAETTPESDPETA
ncbi:hypothetical protein [Novosphingobium sp. TCA1]|uniref:hypothetical protein n=1 Tax=Novosphingobium sp. TCA1 TaxID=2682474 RepID=UPI00130A75F6|nr:hypothetical protein [Novosphingobium sp. TCA1]GFE77731.1 hypothetical protein NTCA1_53800 [Novosphingobium sp. TCA1]